MADKPIIITPEQVEREKQLIEARRILVPSRLSIATGAVKPLFTDDGKGRR